MKHIKNILLLLFLSVVTCMTQACSHDEDIDDLQSSMDNYNADMAIIVNPITLSGATLIDTDLNGYTYIANPQILSDNKINQKGNAYFILTLPFLRVQVLTVFLISLLCK